MGIIINLTYTTCALRVDDEVSMSRGRDAASLAATGGGVTGVPGTVGPRIYDRERAIAPRHQVMALVVVVVAPEKSQKR
jgi:hypothetical protein